MEKIEVKKQRRYLAQMDQNSWGKNPEEQYLLNANNF